MSPRRTTPASIKSTNLIIRCSPNRGPTQVHDLVLVYKAGGYMPSGSVTFQSSASDIESDIASDGAMRAWPAFRNDNADGADQPGEVKANVPITVAADGSTVTATGDWNAGTEIRVEYKGCQSSGRC